jgi:flagellar basal-body rod protein FlgB
VAPANANRALTARVIESPDTETTIDGNSVVLEDQMVRAAETRMAFESGLALYQKGLQLMRMAARPPGRG